MKEIICSKASTTVLRNLQKILEVIFGKVDIECFTISGDGRSDKKQLRYLWAIAKTAYPALKYNIRAELSVIVDDKYGVILDPSFRHYVRVEDSTGVAKGFTVWNHPDTEIVQIGTRTGGPAVWLEGSNVNNRWTRPYFEHQTTGLSYDI